MSLTLRVQTYRKQAPATPVERRFDQLGGTIGRAAGNDLELPDPGKYISRNHSKIDFAEGRYTLMDLGANPSWINDRPVGAGKVASLEHGDRLMIGDYVLEVLVEQPSHAVVPVFSTETSDALPFQAQPQAAAGSAPPQYEPVADTLSGMKVLDVAGHFDGLAAPSANDPLGLGLHGEAQLPTPQQIAAYRGSEADHLAPQFMPMQAGLLPGQQPGMTPADGAQQPYIHRQQVAQQQASPQGQYQPASQPGQPLQAQAFDPSRQAAASQPQTWPAPFPAAGGANGAWPAAFPSPPQGAAAGPAAGAPDASPLAPSPFAAEPTVLVMRTPTAAPTAPPPPSVLIPDDYDPLADLAPQRAQGPALAAPGWPQAGAGAAAPQQGWQQGAAMTSTAPAGADGALTPQGWPQAGAGAVQAPPGWPHAAGAAAPPAGWQQAGASAATPAQGWPQVAAGAATPPQGWPQPAGAAQHGMAHPSVMQTMSGMPGMAPQGYPPVGAMPSPQQQNAWPVQAAPPPAGWHDPAQQAGWPGQAAAAPGPWHDPAQQPGWTAPAHGVQPAPYGAGYPYPQQAGLPAMPGQGDAVLQALLRGMGLSALQLNRDPVATAELAGAMLREAVSGTMTVLMARAMTKRESRLDMTVLGAQANNPLKFFPDAESALAQMLTNAMSGYMPPVKAIGSAYDDLKAHELAVIAGMRAALKGVMSRFDPAQIEAAEPEGVMDKMMAAARKARMWDNMKALYGDIVREADDDFQHLFGEKFSAAYEDQIGRLHRNP